MASTLLVKSLLLFSFMTTCLAIRCMECVDSPKPSDCEVITECANDSVCYLDKIVTQGGLIQHAQGCKAKQQCDSIGSGPQLSRKRGSELIVCDKCCDDKDFCNQHGCGMEGTAPEKRGPWCFDCKMQSEQDTCRTIKQCDMSNVCALTEGNIFNGEFTTGCIARVQCSAIHVLDATYVQPQAHIVGKRGTIHPVCCDWDFCNDNRTLGNMPGGIQVDGHWSDWNEWAICTETCGSNGTRHRTRTCDNPAPQSHGITCPGQKLEEVSCANLPCSVDGGWSLWSTGSACSATCGSERTKTMTRTCDNPAPQMNGQNCTGLNVQQNSCLDVQCPVDGHWSEWIAWSPCSKTCGTGMTHTRYRSCNSPMPAYSGKDCEGFAFQNKPCNDTACPGDGQWSTWGNWSACSQSCGAGSMYKSRTCDNPPPSPHGNNCSGHSYLDISCFNGPCPVDGQWSPWGPFSVCTPACGTGRTMSRHRTCDSPAPAFNGSNCTGQAIQQNDCVDAPCPVDGHWSKWGFYSACTPTCGTGRTGSMHRTCDSPAPAYNGKNCAGNSTQPHSCVDVPCPVDGQWSAWETWSDCHPVCGTGSRKQRHRQCNNPPPMHHGHQCQGNKNEKMNCTYVHCPVDGVWSVWGQWATCTASCGNGMHLRNRVCDHPPPQYNGTDCQGSPTDVKDCMGLSPCQIDGQWSPWSQWSPCSVTCGIANKLRTRSCDDPAPQHNGTPCGGDRLEVDFCRQHECPVDGQWSQWTDWSTCTATCGTIGNKLRTRSCDDPAPQDNGQQCSGDTKEVDVCNRRDCSVDGQWSAWGTWSMCAATCGTDVDRARTRTCDNPAPLYHGKDCLGDGLDMEHCSVNPCIGKWAEWYPWSTCTATCGPQARRIRTRVCDNQLHGIPCTGGDQETDHCNAPNC